MEIGTIITTEDTKEEGPCGDTNAGRESGAGGICAGESGRVQECGEYRKAMWEVCKAPDTMCGSWGGTLC